jgi:hypothetical protein
LDPETFNHVMDLFVTGLYSLMINDYVSAEKAAAELEEIYQTLPPLKAQNKKTEEV